MPKWGKKECEATDASLDGNAIGLTQAFKPLDEDDFEPKRGKHARRSREDGNAIGLTQAFKPIDADGFSVPEPRAEDKESAFWDEGAFQDEESSAYEDAAESESVPVQGAQSEQGVQPEQEVQPEQNAQLMRERKAKDAELPEYMHKSRRMRRILTVVIVLLVLLLAAGAFFVWQLFETAATSASQQTQTQQTESIEGSEATDASTSVVKKTTVPNLVSIIGMTQDEAVEALQHGAQVSGVTEVNEEGNPVKSEVRVALTSEPADTRTGTPTVYLGLDEGGVVVQAGYSTATTSLGYGSLSFSDAVVNEHIVEKTLEEAGVDVEEGSVSLPADKAEYSTYGSDGKTLVKEYCSFVGAAQADGVTYEWSAVLSYDYSTANATGNLADTVRLIYVYVNA